MRAVKCDRCGRFSVYGFHVSPMLVYTESEAHKRHIYANVSGISDDIDDIHTCEECSNQLTKVVEAWWKDISWYEKRVKAFGDG